MKKLSNEVVLDIFKSTTPLTEPQVRDIINQTRWDKQDKESLLNELESEYLSNPHMDTLWVINALKDLDI